MKTIEQIANEIAESYHSHDNFLQQHLVDHNINSTIKNKTITVPVESVKHAKELVKKAGFHDYQIVGDASGYKPNASNIANGMIRKSTTDIVLKK